MVIGKQQVTSNGFKLFKRILKFRVLELRVLIFKKSSIPMALKLLIKKPLRLFSSNKSQKNSELLDVRETLNCYKEGRQGLTEYLLRIPLTQPSLNSN